MATRRSHNDGGGIHSQALRQRSCSNVGVTIDMYLDLRTVQVLNASLLLAVTDVHLQIEWKGMRCRDLTVMTQTQANGWCRKTSLRSRAAIQRPEAMCILHFTPMLYNVVIALKQGTQVDLIWCDSLQQNGQQALVKYAQYYHFLEQHMNRPKRYQPNRHYSSALTIRTHSLTLLRQTNGTDCGIFILLYHHTFSKKSV
jgi:hypothetical protein